MKKGHTAALLSCILGFSCSDTGLFAADPVPLEWKGGQVSSRELREWWGQVTQIHHSDVVKLYAMAEGLSDVYALMVFDMEEKKQKAIGAMRLSLHATTLDALVKGRAFGDRLGVLQLEQKEIGPRDPLYFTLYPLNPSLSGRELVAEYRRLFRQVTAAQGTALDPEQMDIYPGRYETHLPDWRYQERVDHWVARGEGKTFQVRNEGLGRGVTPVFTWYEVDKEGKVQAQQKHPAEVSQFFLHPDYVDRYARGASLQAWHLFHAHPKELRFQAAALLASVDRGIGLRLRATKVDDYRRLSDHEREQVVRSLFLSGGVGAEQLHLLKVVLDAAVNMTVMKEQPEQNKAMAFAPILDWLKAEGYRGEGVDEAYHLFQREGRRLLILNILQLAEGKGVSSLLPEISVAEKVPLFEGKGETQWLTIDEQVQQKMSQLVFVELATDPWLWEGALLDRLKEQQGQLTDSLNELAQVAQKERQLFSLNEALSDNEAVARRLELVAELESLYGRLQGKNGLETHPGQLEGWLYGALRETLKDQVGGDRLLLYLDQFRQEAADHHSPLVSPQWLARIQHSGAFLDLLKVYSEEGEINSEVLKASLVEGLGYLPGISSGLYEVEGEFQEGEKLTLSRSFPGHGSLALQCTLADGRLSGPQGESFAEAVGTDYPALVSPFGGREGIYSHFYGLARSAIRRDPAVWYTEREYPDGWQDREMYYLEKLTKQVVDQWVEGKGPYREVTRPPEASALREQLQRQLMADYLVGKSQLLAKEMEQAEGQRGQLTEALERVAELHGAVTSLTSDHVGDAALAAQLALGVALKQMPVTPPDLGLLNVPGAEVRARLVGSLGDHPTPWQVEWRLETPVGEAISWSNGASIAQGSYLLHVQASDGQGKELSKGEVALELVPPPGKGLDKAALGAARETVGRLEDMAHRTEAFSGEIDALCAPAFQKMADMGSEIADLSAKLDTLTYGLEALESRAEHITELVPEAMNLRNVVGQSSKRAALAREEIRSLVEQVCHHRDALAAEEVLEARKRHLSGLQDILADLNKLGDRMREDYKLAVGAAQRLGDVWRIVAALSDSFVTFKKEMTDVEPRLWQLKRLLSDLEGDLMDSRVKADRVRQLYLESSELLDKLTVSIGGGAEGDAQAQQMLWEAQGFFGHMRSLAQKADECPASLAERLTPVRQMVSDLSGKRDTLLAQGNVLRKAIYDGGFQDHVKHSWEDVEATMTVLNLFRPRLHEQWQDARKCADEAEGKARRTLSVAVPGVEGLSAAEAKAQLEDLHFKVEVGEGSQQSPVASQVPPAGSEAVVGDTIKLELQQIPPRSGGFLVCRLRAVHESIAKERAVVRAFHLDESGRLMTLMITDEAADTYPSGAFAEGARLTLPIRLRQLHYPHNKTETLSATLNLEVVERYSSLQALYEAHEGPLRHVHMTIEGGDGSFEFADLMPEGRLKGWGGPLLHGAG